MPTLPTPKVFCRSITTLKTIHERLDALDAGPSRFYIRLLLLTGFSWAVRAAELVLFIFTRDLIDEDVGMGSIVLQTLGIGEFFGAALGGPLFGRLADFRGRRSALLLAMALSLTGLALSAVATKDYYLVITRVVAGVGLGGELPAAIVLVHELSPKSMRGPMVALLEAFAGIGSVIGASLAFGLAPQFGWRNTYWVICACILYTGVLRCGIPESPRWLASVGREEAAQAVVEKLEKMHQARPHYESVNMQDTSTLVVVESQPSVPKTSSTFGKPVHTLLLWLLWTVMALSAYALGVFVPTLISLSGFNMYESWVGNALSHGSQAVGCVLAWAILKARGHKQALVCFVTLVSVAAVSLSYAPWNRLTVIAGTCSVSAMLAGAWSCVLAYTPENYPTAVRARGVSYAFGFSRLGAAGGALICPYMFNVWLMTVPSIAWVFSGVLAAAVLVIVVPDGTSASSNRYMHCPGRARDTEL